MTDLDHAVQQAEATPTEPTIEPKLAGYTGYLARPAYLRAQRTGLAALPSGRHPRDIGLLTVLAEYGPLAQARAGELLGLNRTVVVQVVDGLEGTGLVLRDRDPADRRRYALRLTQDGRTTLSGMYAAMTRAEQALVAPLTPHRHRRLNHLLRSLAPQRVTALPDALTGRTGFLIANVYRSLRDQCDRALCDLGLQPRHLGVLAALDSTQPCSQRHLAGCMGVSGPAVVKSIDELTTAGLLVRDRNPDDRREHVLRLTPLGAERFADALDSLDAVQRQLTELHGEPEMAELHELLFALATAPKEASS